MAAIDISTFTGEVPRLPAHALPANAAQLAVNCDFAHSELRSLPGIGSRYTTAAPVRSLFTDNGLRFFAWDVPTRAFLAPTIDDAFARVYYANASGLRVTHLEDMDLAASSPTAPSSSWAVGVSPSAGALSAVVSGTPDEGSTPEDIVYQAVAVNVWGEESAPLRSVTVTASPGQTVSLSIAVTPAAGQKDLAGVAFYRTYAASQSTVYLLINTTPAGISGGVSTLVDPNDGPQTAVALASASWEPPPADVFDVCYIGNGMVCGASGKDLVVTEPYRPHAWAYRMTFPFYVTGVIPVEGGALVLTAQQPYLVLGSRPDQLSQQALNAEQAGIPGRTKASSEGALGYVTNDGMVSISGGQASLSGFQQLFTRRDWRARYGDALRNLIVSGHDGMFVAAVDPAYPIALGARQGFVLRMDEAQGAFSRLDIGEPIYGLVSSASTDTLYVGLANGFAEFGDGALLPLTWWSRDFEFGAEVGFSVGVIRCTGTFTVTIYAAGSVRHTFAATGDTTFRLPPGSDRKWSVKIEGSGTVRRLTLAESFDDLRRLGL